MIRSTGGRSVLYGAVAGALLGCDAAEPTRTLTETVGASDVSFLYPLPADRAQRTSLLGLDASGRRGPLLPQALYDRLPPLDTLASNQELYFLQRVVGVRLDPCFPAPSAPGGCLQTLRMVVQPVVPADGAGLTTTDLALHLFYRLEGDELPGLLQDLATARRTSGLPHDDELPAGGAHPLLTREGISGPFAARLRGWLLDHAGADTLFRVTFMGREHVGVTWRFGAFSVENKQLTPLKIPLLSVTEQTFTNRDFAGETFLNAGTLPVSPSAADVRLLFEPALFRTASDEARNVAHENALRVENPVLETPESIDCATCHAVGPALALAETSVAFSSADRAYRRPDGTTPRGATGPRTNELRAFGYFGVKPSISQRAANETAAVVVRVNETLRK